MSGGGVQGGRDDAFGGGWDEPVKVAPAAEAVGRAEVLQARAGHAGGPRGWVRVRDVRERRVLLGESSSVRRAGRGWQCGVVEAGGVDEDHGLAADVAADVFDPPTYRWSGREGMSNEVPGLVVDGNARNLKLCASVTGLSAGWLICEGSPLPVGRMTAVTGRRGGKGSPRRHSAGLLFVSFSRLL